MPSLHSVFPLLIALGGMLFGLLFSGIGWHLWSDGRELRASGVSTVALIEQKLAPDELAPGSSLDEHFFRSRFQDPAGRTYTVDLPVPAKLWMQLDEGDTTVVTYVKTDPHRVRAGGRLGWRIRGGVGVLLLLFGASALVFFPLLAYRDTRRPSRSTTLPSITH